MSLSCLKFYMKDLYTKEPKWFGECERCNRSKPLKSFRLTCEGVTLAEQENLCQACVEELIEGGIILVYRPEETLLRKLDKSPSLLDKVFSSIEEEAAHENKMKPRQT